MHIVLSAKIPPMIPGTNGGLSKLFFGQPFMEPGTKLDGSFMSFKTITFQNQTVLNEMYHNYSDILHNVFVYTVIHGY